MVGVFFAAILTWGIGYVILNLLGQFFDHLKH